MYPFPGGYIFFPSKVGGISWRVHWLQLHLHEFSRLPMASGVVTQQLARRHRSLGSLEVHGEQKKRGSRRLLAASFLVIFLRVIFARYFVFSPSFLWGDGYNLTGAYSSNGSVVKNQQHCHVWGRNFTTICLERK